MQIPEELKQAIEPFFENISTHSLRRAREALSKDYQEGATSPFEDEGKRLAYLGARMPATFAAVHQVLQKLSLKGHLLDLGAGPGTASWAGLTLFPELEKITLLEKNPEAIALGKKLAQAHPILRNATWIQENLDRAIPEADSAILSYVVGELEDYTKVIEHCWRAVSTLIIVEPGTPKAFERMKKIREQLIALKAYIIAPCPHLFHCPNPWCHFSTRVERSRLHRLLKGGSLGFEDEKFCYLIASKSPSAPFSARVIRQPLKCTGHVRLSLCTKEGMLVEKTISKKEKNSYRLARNSEWGSQM